MFFNYVHVRVSVCECVHMWVQVPLGEGAQKRALHYLPLQSWVVSIHLLWILWMALGFLSRAIRTLNHHAVSPAPGVVFWVVGNQTSESSQTSWHAPFAGWGLQKKNLQTNQEEGLLERTVRTLRWPLYPCLPCDPTSLSSAFLL